MALYNWKRLPKREYQRVIVAIENYDLDELLDIYYEYKLGKSQYCCPFDGMYRHFKSAVENNLIVE